METLILCAIKDVDVDTFIKQFFVKELAFAERAIEHEVNQPDSELAAHPYTFQLHQLGFLDVQSGQYEEIAEENRYVGLAADYIKEVKESPFPYDAVIKQLSNMEAQISNIYARTDMLSTTVQDYISNINELPKKENPKPCAQ